MSVETESFAALCRAGRAILNWSQTDLAARAGMGMTTINRIESGQVNPRHDSVLGIIRSFEGAGLEVESYRTQGGFTITAPQSLFLGKGAVKQPK